jgi:hypothetical protein
MSDIYHVIGGDLVASDTGDLSPVDGTQEGQQRVLRRLITRPQTSYSAADYAEHPDYGGGLARYVGDVLDVPKTTAAIRGQILLESCVAKMPEPVITVTQIPRGMSCSILYNDANTGQPISLNFDITV